MISMQFVVICNKKYLPEGQLNRFFFNKNPPNIGLQKKLRIIDVDIHHTYFKNKNKNLKKIGTDKKQEIVVDSVKGVVKRFLFNLKAMINNCS